MQLTPAAGETLTREGGTAHHLYILVSGEVSVRVGGIAESNQVALLRAGEFFGEMALLTGEKRRATCIAVSNVDCYRLDWVAFRELLERHPELAEQVAAVLLERKAGLDVVRERVDGAQDDKHRADNQRDLVFKIRTFFNLD